MRGQNEAVTTNIAVADVDTPVGPLGVGVTEAGLAAVGWTDATGIAQRCGLPVVDAPEWTAPVLEQLRGYFAGELRSFSLPLDWSFARGTRLAVLRTLHTTVGYGESVTYGELAVRSGTGAPARVIGGIMGGNPLPIVVPCHRVVAGDGLGGYSGGSGRNGLEVKRWLLTMEGALEPTLDWELHGLR